MSAEPAEFTQTIFIARPAAVVWTALTRKEIVDRYFLVPLGTTEPAVGKEIFWGPEDGKMIVGEVLAMEEPSLFAHSFRFTDNDEDPDSRVTYEIDALGEMCALHLTHACASAESRTYQDIAGGWPVALSGLKTLLETGTQLPWPQAES